MNKILIPIAAALLCGLQSHASTIKGDLFQLLGTRIDRPTPSVELISIATGVSYPVTPEDGKVQLSLPGGEYLVKIGELALRINLPDDGAAYSLKDLITARLAQINPLHREYPVPNVYVSPNDTSSGFLSWKIQPGTNVTFTTNAAVGGEYLTVNATAPGGGGGGSGSGGATTNAAYILRTLDPGLPNGFYLTNGTNVTFTWDAATKRLTISAIGGTSGGGASNAPIVFDPASFGTNALGQVEIKKGITLYVKAIKSSDGKEEWEHKSVAENPGANNSVRFTDLPEDRVMAASDQTTRIIAGHTFTWPVTRTYNILWARAFLLTGQNAGTSPIFTVDLRLNGTSILKNRLTIDNGETDSMNAAAQAELIAATVPVTYKDTLTAVVTQVGEGNPAGLFIITYGER